MKKWLFNRRFETNKLLEYRCENLWLFNNCLTGKTMKMKIKFFPESELIEILMLEHPREGIFYSLEIE